MSLINKMLQDLDARGSHTGAGPDAVRPVQGQERRAAPRLLLIGALVLGAGGAAALGWRTLQRPKAPAAAPAAVAAAPAPTPTPTSTPTPAPTPPAPPAPTLAAAPAAALPEAAPAALQESSRAARAAEMKRIRIKQERAEERLRTGERVKASEHDKSGERIKSSKRRKAERIEAERLAAENAAKEEKAAKAAKAAKRAAARAAAAAPVSIKAAPAAAAVQGKQSSSQQRAENEYRGALSSLQEGRVAESIAGLQRALAVEPRHQAARETLVRLLLEGKRQNDAMRQMQLGLGLDPAQPAMAMLLARLQMEQGGPAVDTLMRTLPFVQSNSEYRAFLAAVLQRGQRHKEAAEQYELALRGAPQNGVWWMGLGISLQAEQRLGEAKDAFARAKASSNLTPELQAFVERKLQLLAR